MTTYASATTCRFVKRTRAERGSAFVVTLVLVVGFLALTVAGLSGAKNGLSVSNNYKTGLQAHLAAEAGALHGQKVAGDYGVLRFNNDIVPNWATLFGTSSKSIPGYSSASYTVTVANDPVDSSRYMLLTSVGMGLGESQRSVQVRLFTTNAFSPGAIYLPNANVAPNFNGTSFGIDGHDMDLGGGLHPENDVPGIGTRFDPDRQTVLDALNPSQEPLVDGIGGTPSVDWTFGPSTDRILNEIIPAILSQPGVVTNPVLNGTDTFGTIANPQITHFTGSVHLSGTVRGAGILIVDQGLTISGDASFTGLIIVQGTTQITSISGSATLLGALWTTDVNLNVSGTASITYSTQALGLADGTGGGALLPKKVTAVAWNEL